MRATIPEERTTDQPTSILLQEEGTALPLGSECINKKSLFHTPYYPALPRQDEQMHLICLLLLFLLFIIYLLFIFI